MVPRKQPFYLKFKSLIQIIGMQQIITDLNTSPESQAFQQTAILALQKDPTNEELQKCVRKAIHQLENKVSDNPPPPDIWWCIDRLKSGYEHSLTKPSQQDLVSNSTAQLTILATVATLLLGFGLSTFFTLDRTSEAMPLLAGIFFEFFALVLVLFITLYFISDFETKKNYTFVILIDNSAYVRVLETAIAFVIIGIAWFFVAIVVHTWNVYETAWGTPVVILFSSMVVVFLVFMTIKWRRCWIVVDE